MYCFSTGDYLQYANGRPFSTKDKDLDRHLGVIALLCSKVHGGTIRVITLT